LQIVARLDCSDVSVCVLQSGADVKLRDHEGFSAAYYAQMSGNIDCVQLLHSLGSPLHTVAMSLS